jgi:hypothetical protein
MNICGAASMALAPTPREKIMRMNKLVGSSLAAAVMVVVAASPALAEGDIKSSISGWLPGKETRDWNDGHTDSDKTTLQNNRCSSDTGNNVSSLTWELNRNDTATPDEHYGNKKLTCTATSAATTARRARETSTSR